MNVLGYFIKYVQELQGGKSELEMTKVFPLSQAGINKLTRGLTEHPRLDTYKKLREARPREWNEFFMSHPKHLAQLEALVLALLPPYADSASKLLKLRKQLVGRPLRDGLGEAITLSTGLKVGPTRTEIELAIDLGSRLLALRRTNPGGFELVEKSIRDSVSLSKEKEKARADIDKRLRIEDIERRKKKGSG